MYFIELTDEAQEDLKGFDRREQNIIVDGIKANLSYEPTVITRNRKPCREARNKIADWELRLGIYRIFYNVYEQVKVVEIERIGEKPNNTVFLRQQK